MTGGCPFGFSAAAGHDAHGSDVGGGDSPSKRAAPNTSSSGKCPFAAMGRQDADDDDRFDYNKDPVSWFYQNQIKSEEQFQAHKAELREAARGRLEDIFEKKGKHLIIDSDDEFSINTSELSAWDSDVHSIRTLASCANSWAAGAEFKAPALVTLRVLVLATMAAAAYGGWHSLQGVLSVNRFLGIVTVGWVPSASLAAASIAAVDALVLWWMTDSKSKAGLLGCQLAMQLVCAACCLLAATCFAHPIRVDPHFGGSLCQDNARQGPKASEAASRLCHYLPVVQEQIDLVIATLLRANAVLAVLGLGVACAGSWHMWELAYVEKKAAKHKRRRRQRKRSIPWDKIKVEDMGPISYCGAAPPQQQQPASAKGAAAAAAAGVAAATTGSDGATKKRL